MCSLKYIRIFVKLKSNQNMITEEKYKEALILISSYKLENRKKVGRKLFELTNEEKKELIVDFELINYSSKVKLVQEKFSIGINGAKRVVKEIRGLYEKL